MSGQRGTGSRQGILEGDEVMIGRKRDWDNPFGDGMIYAQECEGL